MRACNALRRARIDAVGQLAALGNEEILDIRNLERNLHWLPPSVLQEGVNLLMYHDHALMRAEAQSEQRRLF